MRRARGFSLTELMIAVAVVGILAAVAYPSYQNYLRKGTRAAAQSAMMQIADRQAQYLLDARTYAIGAGALGTLNVTLPRDVDPHYTITVTASDGTDTPTKPPSYTITATPKASSAQVADGVLTLTHTGAKTRAGVSGW
jgi:type IV pilus assembly protein PilE